MYLYVYFRYNLEESVSPERSEVPAILNGLSTPVPPSAFLTVTDLNLSIHQPEPSPSSSSLRSKYKLKTVPRTCSAHLHRMFIRICDSDASVSEHGHRDDEDESVASSEYEEYTFEDYLRDLGTPVEEPEVEVPACPTPEPEIIEAPVLKVEKEKPVKVQKRKSITISRLPSPETVQIIRVDVITGYPVDSDTSILSESEISVEKKADVEWGPGKWEGSKCKDELVEDYSLFNCKSLSLSHRN